MKKLLLILLFCMIPFVYAEDIDLSEEEIDFLESQDQILLGLDPYTGMDFFEFEGKNYGYLIDLVDLINSELQTDIVIVSDQTWSQAYSGLQNGDIDILFGANETEERLKFMSFTKAIYEYPYAVFIRKNDVVKTMGDLDHRRIGFLEDDIVIDLFQDAYSGIDYTTFEYADQFAGLQALESGFIDGFVTSGGGIKYDFIYKHPDIKVMTEIEDMTSQMTLSTHKDNDILAGILEKVIVAKSDQVDGFIHEAVILYNRNILQLSQEELDWFDQDGVAVVGVVEDYLPFDHYEDGHYLGIAGAIIDELSNLVGIEFEYRFGTFDEIYELTLNGEVDILNMAKTSDRLEYFNFPRSFREERDIIYGTHASSVNDIYGLEGMKVAVIEGFWHEEMLVKSLRNPVIVKTESIQETLELLRTGRVDYFIENPTVADYYIRGLGYNDIIKKGETSSDSFLYFGVTKSQTELAGIIDKALLLVDYEKQKEKGLNSVPVLVSKKEQSMIYIIGVLVVIVIIGGYFLRRAFKSLISEKETTARLIEREKLMYLDPLTGLKNRLYFNAQEEKLLKTGFPQGIIMSDLNRLKHINDTMGHHMGDAYIQKYGQVLNDVFKDDLVCRMGGDEFLIVMFNTTEAEIKERLVKLSHVCKSVDFEQMPIDAAVGYEIRYDNQSFEEVMIVADNKMYHHKRINRKER
ncbi:transporter substrate-binding domain-containing protein [Acidaminobacter sp. JC074]|uniref:transporter substrate-binding domain-containing diguanylate cyclase n=1 Tax=Acidaminobacter sp. JC074 TaxID=2530199 RepID=UPI001F0DAD79|nr:transporter substrate-binding domain-containing protein [Acidaminobacter sp. JC074]MCH4886122.1 transporter substrate-binding domain-containing protein [Acidaminobacter sp. JC074]